MAHLSTRRQGDLGELSAMQWLGSQGYGVWIPIGHSPDCDLIAEDDEERLLRAQVKTTKRAWQSADNIGEAAGLDVGNTFGRDY